ncbi:WD domain, G-beta repeat-containing protein [Cardiosporidium cionae]|uniref:WD domain, G-beta repeat-containing protein n=1 Tax=Cardiosporidium cionae TaxID=476202 RepID=A0ABQ7J8Y4_9APIC|nr:WD domain, G-beta repeat-containing protein [Cardiosporidium cionae]|eukprot:KAF8820426.1 WD domain, G-beta repeat-containing protein [Cardiosporidium cionae]
MLLSERELPTTPLTAMMEVKHPMKTYIEQEMDDANDESKTRTIREQLNTATAVASNEIARSCSEDYLRKNVEEEPESNQWCTTPEDYIQNYLLHYGMNNSLAAFQKEWYSQKKEKSVTKYPSSRTKPQVVRTFDANPEFCDASNLPEYPIQMVPGGFVHHLALHKEQQDAKAELETLQQKAEDARNSADAMRKEKNAQQIQCRQLEQEKQDFQKKYKKSIAEHVKAKDEIKDLQKKLSTTVKEKALLRLEKDRFLNRANCLQIQLDQRFGKAVPKKEGDESSNIKNTKLEGKESKQNTNSSKLTPFRWPPDKRRNPFRDSAYQREEFIESDIKLAHTAAISGLAFNPKTQLLATASDDGTWKLWNVPDGELVMCGEGHEKYEVIEICCVDARQSWVSAIAFHHTGDIFASSSGDSTVKIWSIISESCLHTITNHTQPIWDVAFHDIGDFVVTASLDRTAKCFDIRSYKCRQTFRGHTDSVNSVSFIPYSNILCTASKDKSISLWDVRSGRSEISLFGHTSSCSHAAVNPQGTVIASCDIRGVVKIWDIRTAAEHMEIQSSQASANRAAFDRSGNILAVASSDASIKIIDVYKNQLRRSLTEHKGSVQAVQFDPTNKILASASSDQSFQIWQTMTESLNFSAE